MWGGTYKAMIIPANTEWTIASSENPMCWIKVPESIMRPARVEKKEPVDKTIENEVQTMMRMRPERKILYSLFLAWRWPALWTKVRLALYQKAAAAAAHKAAYVKRRRQRLHEITRKAAVQAIRKWHPLRKRGGRVARLLA